VEEQTIVVARRALTAWKSDLYRVMDRRKLTVLEEEI